MKQLKIKLYQPTSLQLKVHQSTAIYRILACGRRFGKNYIAQNENAKNAWENPDTISWWCSPIYKVANRDYRRFCKWFPKIIRKKWDSELRIELINDSVIEYFGMDKAQNIEGEGVNFMYVDECGNIKDEVWYNTLMPMLLDTNGRALMFGTPKGKNWFYTLFGYGQDKNKPEYECWQYPSAANPYIDKMKIKRAQEDMPELAFRQEYLAEFIDDEGLVFRGFLSCIDNSINIDNARPIPGHYYRIGMDLAKQLDYTVLTVVDIATKQVVGWYRWNTYDWVFQKERIVSLARYWNDAEIIFDVMNVGQSVGDDLKSMGLSLSPYTFSNQTKADLIENLMLLFDTRAISIPAIPELLKELEIFEYEKLPSGKIRYNAPSGYHDDCVISLALAFWDVMQEPIESSDFKTEKVTSFTDMM